MSPRDNTDPSVAMEFEIADDGEIEPALALIFRDHLASVGDSYAENFASSIRDGSLPADGLLVARRAGQLLGAVLVQTQPGRSALLWPPRTIRDAPAFVPGTLLGGACSRLAAAGVRLVHALLPSVSRADDRLLRQFDFAPLATLFYLECVLPPSSSPPEGPLTFETFNPAESTRLHHILRATYAGSLDCPQTDKIREIDDVLASYQATGVFDPARWFYVCHGGDDVGCLLLTDHPDQDQWELMYMGLAGWARGKGWGAAVVRFALYQAVLAGRGRVVVAVDAANQPAVAMYLACGFQQWQRRFVYFRNLLRHNEPAAGASAPSDSPDVHRPGGDTVCGDTT
jgi:mycothiol synthase